MNDIALLLCGQARSDQCFGTSTSAAELLLHGHASSDQCFGTLTSATALLLRGQARSDQCFGPLISATALLLCGQARMSLMSVSALLRYATALQLCAIAVQYYTVPSGTYCVVSYSFLITG